MAENLPLQILGTKEGGSQLSDLGSGGGGVDPAAVQAIIDADKAANPNPYAKFTTLGQTPTTGLPVGGFTQKFNNKPSDFILSGGDTFEVTVIDAYMLTTNMDGTGASGWRSLQL